MGCGCNRNSRPKTTLAKQNNPIIQTNTVIVSNVNNNNINNKRNICKSCPFSTKNSAGIFSDSSRCRKANRSILSILRDETFICPMKRF